MLVHQEGVACHTGSRTCFFTRLDAPGAAPGAWEAGAGILETVERVIQARKVERPEGSYVARLLAKGDPGVLKKIGEEAAEVVVAASTETPAAGGRGGRRSLVPHPGAARGPRDPAPRGLRRAGATARGRPRGRAGGPGSLTLHAWGQGLALAVAGGVMLAGCAAGRSPHGERRGGVARQGLPGDRAGRLGAVPSVDADVALRQAALGAGLMAHGTCEGKTPRRTLPVLVRHLRFGLRDVEGLDQTPVMLSGRPGVRSRFTARLDGVPVAVGAVTLDGGRCVYDLVVVVAPPEGLAAVAADFERFAQSFELTGERAP